ncbi:type IV pilin [Halopelagius longus]|uniref:Archaeal Type IV pilin N-terminal domain-containing protein n=1 Tax=Halopelagius longus TaxID=1236180 RepID=A0A1H0YQF4_9EURY|nr:type IV pilin [Halopelagius longus]RDI72624.1 hypothetical protein DWB78_13340 [Halopelagius longus]SDQ17457.1 hypothetical protein SAMN05216278_0784 [Halopelagius longus]
MADARPGSAGGRRAGRENAPCDDRGQVESVGSVLLLGVVVVCLATFGAFYLAEGSGVGGDEGADTAVVVDASAERLSVAHNGGESIPVDAVGVLVRDGSGESSHAMNVSAVRGDGDGRFEGGESWRLEWTRSAGEEVTVLVVNDRSGSVLYRETVTVSAAGEPTNAARGDGGDGR